MRKELSELVLNVEHIKEIVAMQQSYARVMGVAEVVKLSDVMEDAIKMQGGAYERHGINLIRDYVSTPPVALDKHKVMQILVNFINNAKCTTMPLKKRHKGIILMQTRQVGKDRVRFGRSRTTASACSRKPGTYRCRHTTRKNGHGFGLHSGRTAAKELGGDLGVSVMEWARATFSLELPLIAQAEAGQT